MSKRLRGSSLQAKHKLCVKAKERISWNGTELAQWILDVKKKNRRS